MLNAGESLPKVVLSPVQRWRLIAVGIVVAFVVARAVPDAIRLGMPLGLFFYSTDSNGVVVTAAGHVPKGSDRLRPGDRVRIDRIKPFDRKPGLALEGFTVANPDRHLPIERGGHERILHLISEPESPESRAIVLLRLLLFLTSIAFSAILFIVKPRTATLAFFVFTAGAEAPTTYADAFFDVPWREIVTWVGDTVQGFAPVALLLFATCLSIRQARVRHIVAIGLGVLGLVLGTLRAYTFWRLTYAGLPAAAFANLYETAETVLSALNAVAFITAFAVARGGDRQRTGYIMAAFALAGAGRLASEHLFPEHINSLENGILLSLGVVPAIVVWVAVVKHHFFDVDFVVSKALVYTAVTASVIAVIGSSEELLTYVFYNNTDLATGILIGISMGVGAAFGKIREVLEHFVDRFIFRERREQRKTLERIAANLLDADDEAVVLRTLLHDVPSVLDLAFSGIMTRDPADGIFRLTHESQWPPHCIDTLAADHAFMRDIAKNHGIVADDALRSNLMKALFPNAPLTYAAPLYVDRSIYALTLYGRSVSGLDLDPEERLSLVRIMANASIALATIELARYRTGRAAAAVDARPAPALSDPRPDSG